ncbi:MAG: hypothetical protein ACM359_21780 [Bacillota bacterium]
MESIESVGPQADDEKVFSHKLLNDNGLADGGNDLLQRLGSLPIADQLCQQPVNANWDPERWDGMD